MSELTTGMPLYHSILTGIATGDGQTHTAYKRANVSQEVGDKAVEELCKSGIIKKTKSKKASSKLYFSSPFLRFWFAFVSPIFKGIKEGDYKEFKQRFQNRAQEFSDLCFEKLSQEFIKLAFVDDKIVECSSYWDKEVDFEIYALTASGKRIAGTTKYTNSKLNKNELTKLQEKCQKANIEVDMFLLFSKKGFSNELKALKGENLRLYTIKNFKKLVE